MEIREQLKQVIIEYYQSVVPDYQIDESKLKYDVLDKRELMQYDNLVADHVKGEDEINLFDLKSGWSGPVKVKAIEGKVLKTKELALFEGWTDREILIYRFRADRCGMQLTDRGIRREMDKFKEREENVTEWTVLKHYEDIYVSELKFRIKWYEEGCPLPDDFFYIDKDLGEGE